jgi:hypothetical protein
MLLSDKDYITKKRKELEQQKKRIERLKKGNFRANQLKFIKENYKERQDFAKSFEKAWKEDGISINTRSRAGMRFTHPYTKELYIESAEKIAKDLEAEIKYEVEALRDREEKKDIDRFKDYILYAIIIGAIVFFILGVLGVFD